MAGYLNGGCSAKGNFIIKTMEKKKVITFNFCPIDSCYRYQIKLRDDSFFIENKVNSEVRAGFKSTYDHLPFDDLIQLKKAKTKDFITLQELTKNSYSNEGKVFFIEIFENNQITRFQVTELEKGIKIPRKVRKTYLALINSFNYYQQRYLKIKGAKAVLKND